MPHIKKVLNSSVILVTDGRKDFIILAKGIGYGRKKGEMVDVNHLEHELYLPVTDVKSKQFMALLDSISPDIFELTQEVIDVAKRELKAKFNESLYFTLADHLNFAVERYKENLVVTNRLLWEIKNFYEKEYNVGLICLEIINSKLNINLPEDEAVNLAFHFANAQFPEDSSRDSARTAKLIGELVNLVVYSLNKPIDKQSIHYVRFVTHIRFFVDRFFMDKMLNDNDELYLTVHNKCKKEEGIANRIKTFLEKKYKKEIPNEELAYLTIHINRLNR